MIYKGFEYNKFGVCVNPEIPYEFGIPPPKKIISR